jgi:ABC-2 type transport system permease protein
VLRDPTLISQTLMQVLYIIPPSLLLVHGATRSSGEAAPLAFGAGAVVFLAGQLAGGLGWVAVSGEDARDLIRGAPLTPAKIAQAEALAVVVMVMALLAAPLVALAWFAPWVACVAVMGAAAKAATMALVEHWMAKPGKRSDFRHRQQTSGLAVTFSELLLSFLISAATVTLLLAGVWRLIPAALSGLVLFLFSRNARTIDD